MKDELGGKSWQNLLDFEQTFIVTQKMTVMKINKQKGKKSRKKKT